MSSSIHRSIQRLFAVGDRLAELSNNPSLSQLRNERKTSPENIPVERLVYALMIEDGQLVVGRPHGPFTYWDSAEGCLQLVGSYHQSVVCMSMSDGLNLALDRAHSLGASLFVHDGKAICNIRGISQSGDSFGEAAARALLAYQRDANSESEQIY